MIIKRSFFNDTFHPEIELTKQELFEAYVEQQHIWDVSNTRDHLNATRPDGAYSEDQIDAIAYDARRQADKYDLEWDDAVEEALITLGM